MATFLATDVIWIIYSSHGIHVLGVIMVLMRRSGFFTAFLSLDQAVSDYRCITLLSEHTLENWRVKSAYTPFCLLKII